MIIKDKLLFSAENISVEGIGSTQPTDVAWTMYKSQFKAWTGRKALLQQVYLEERLRLLYYHEKINQQ
jgi:hypothetical protein